MNKLSLNWLPVGRLLAADMLNEWVELESGMNGSNVPVRKRRMILWVESEMTFQRYLLSVSYKHGVFAAVARRDH